MLTLLGNEHVSNTPQLILCDLTRAARPTLSRRPCSVLARPAIASARRRHALNKQLRNVLLGNQQITQENKNLRQRQRQRQRQRHTWVVRGSKARQVRGSTDVEGPLGCSLASVSVQRAAGLQGSPVGTRKAFSTNSGALLLRLRRCIVAVRAHSFAQIASASAVVFLITLEALQTAWSDGQTPPVISKISRNLSRPK